jgi:hypothetical protein
MWDIERLRPASSEGCKIAAFLRETICRNELGESRLPDFVTLSSLFEKPCIPFREHEVETFAPYIYRAIRERGERKLIIFQNPLYDDSLEYVAEADLSDDAEFNALVEESFFSGGFIIGTNSPLFRWFGNFTDYGFMFTDSNLIEAIFLVPAATIYRDASREFRFGQGGDALLDPEVRKLDKLWQFSGRDT